MTVSAIGTIFNSTKKRSVPKLLVGSNYTDQHSLTFET